MTQLYTPDGKPATFADPADALAALRAGKVGVPTGQTVPIIRDGEIYDVPVTEIGKLPDDARLQTQAELAAEQRAAAETEASGLREKRRGTGLGTFERVVDAATGLGRLAAGGLTGLAANPGAITGPLGAAFGGTEEAARSQGREDAWTLGLGKVARKVATEALYGKAAAAELVREKALDRELAPEAYQKGSVEGGIESAVASSALGQPGAGLSRFAAGPQALPELAGALAEAGLARAGLTAGQTAAGHALKGAITMGVRGGVEGAIAGGASELTEEMFGDPEVVGSKVWLAAGKGALAGFATGGVMGAAAPAIGRAFGRAADGAELGAVRAETKLRTAAHDEGYMQAFRHLSPHAKARSVEEAMRKLPDLVDEGELRAVGGVRAVGKAVVDAGVIDARSTVANAATKNAPDAVAGRLRTALDSLGAEKSAAMRGSSAFVTGAELDQLAKKVLDTADNTGLSLRAQGGREAIVNRVEAYAQSLLTKTGMLDSSGKVLADNTIDLGTAYNQRRALADSVWNDYSALEAKGPMKAMRALEREFDDLLMRKVQAAGEDVGRIREVNRQITALRIAQDINADALKKSAKNRVLGMSENQWGVGALIATGDPVTGLATAVAHKQIRERGNAVGAFALLKIGDMQMVAKATERADKLIAQAADGASGTARLPYRSAPPSESLAKRYDAARDHVRELSRQADAVKARADELTTISGAPNVSRAFSSAVTRAAAELVAKLPDDPPQMSPLHKTRPSTDEMRTFLSAYDAATNPEATLREVAAGSLDPAKTSVLKRVAPSAFLDLRDEVEKRTIARIERGDIPKQADLMKLKLAFDITLDPTMTPEALASQHEAMAAGGGNEGAQAPQANGGRRGRASSLKQQREPTGADRFDR